jgi:hypothetical protein
VNKEPFEDQPEFWFNTKTNLVEHGLLTAAPYRIGPFRTEQEAARALQIVADRAKAWREQEATDWPE